MQHFSYNVKHERLLLAGLKGVDGATNTNEVRHLLKVEGNGTHLHGALLRDFGNDLFFGKRSLLLEDALDDVCNGTGLVAPLAQSVEAAADEHELRVADEFVMDGLDGNVLMVEARLADAVGDFHEVEGLTALLQHDFHLVADGAGANKAPLRETPAFVDFAEAGVEGETALDEFLARHAVAEEVESLHGRNHFFAAHAVLPLL